MEHDSIGPELAKLSPPVVVSAVSKSGFTLQEWVYIATLIYTVCGCCYLILKIRRAWKNRNN